ncbi:MAG: hypothetical protein HUU02_11045 [Bacteroidetes bacterium]|nr:hypothetical protein [Bacteroidota bacterium]
MKQSVLLLFLLTAYLFPQIPSRYHSNADLAAALKQLASRYSSVVTVESIAKTLNGNDLWSVRIGKSGAGERKALLIVGGIEGNQPVGTEHALRTIEWLARSYGTADSITSLLDKTTVYVIPRANPDAADAMFASPVSERETNNAPFDDDRDAAVDEDGPEDLNKDGFISWMRIRDPRGEWIIHPDDARVMRKADASKGEKGEFRLYTEGIDNDKDEQWNEDPRGGTDLNRNFTYNYQFFARNSGIHQISEAESKALADFVFDHPSIGLVLTFSSNDNVTTPWKNEPPKGEGNTVTSVAKEDEELYTALAKRFTESYGLKDAPKPVKGEGAFSEWAYYHAGRWSLSVRPWWPGELPKAKETAAAKDSVRKPAESKKEEKDRTDDAAVKTLKWYDAIGTKDAALPWTKFKHPDFPEKEVEIGGLRPFVLSNPPAESLNAFAAPFIRYAVSVASQLPSLTIRNAAVKSLGDNVYRVTADVVNDGFLPTNSALGVKSRWVRNVRVMIDAGKSAAVSSGRTKQVLEPIKGSGGYVTVSWIVVGKGSVRINAESPVAGSADVNVDLK